MKGVIATEAGYSGGATRNRTHEQVCSHITGAMSWQPYRHANKPLLAIVSGDVPQAVGRIRQTVQN